MLCYCTFEGSGFSSLLIILFLLKWPVTRDQSEFTVVITQWIVFYSSSICKTARNQVSALPFASLGFKEYLVCAWKCRFPGYCVMPLYSQYCLFMSHIASEMSLKLLHGQFVLAQVFVITVSEAWCKIKTHLFQNFIMNFKVTKAEH